MNSERRLRAWRQKIGNTTQPTKLLAKIECYSFGTKTLVHIITVLILKAKIPTQQQCHENSSLRAATYPIKMKTIATSLSRGVRSGARAKRRTNDAPSNPSSYGQIVAGDVLCGAVQLDACFVPRRVLYSSFSSSIFASDNMVPSSSELFFVCYTQAYRLHWTYTQTHSHSHSHNRMSPYILNKAKNCDIRCFCLATNCRTHSIFICVTSILPLNSCNTK